MAHQQITSYYPGSWCMSGIGGSFITTLVDFKKTMRAVYGLPVRTEIHASEFVRHNVHGIERYKRLSILRNAIDEITKIPNLSITNVVVDKSGKPADFDVFEFAWKALFQRFENTLRYGNFPGGFRQDYGIVFTDATAGTKLLRLVRKMAVHNPVPNQAALGGGARNLPILKVIEDPHEKDSKESLPIQMADVCAYFLYQRLQPNAYIRRQSAAHYFDRLLPVLNTKASATDPLGIVQL